MLCEAAECCKCEAAECCVCEAAECCVCEATGVLLVCSVVVLGTVSQLASTSRQAAAGNQARLHHTIGEAIARHSAPLPAL